IKTFLAPLADSLAWLDASDANRILASRIEDHNFHALIKEAYFAFEALVQHPFG
ncbi:unnamed protein product, partial [Ectocarpus sp. 12 AP-2014]